MRRPLWFTLTLALLACTGGDPGGTTETQPLDTSTTGPGEEGSRTSSLLFPEDWGPGHQVTNADHTQPLFLQDYSYAGYHNGEVPLPSGGEPLVIVTANTQGESDTSGAIQAALNQAVANGGGIVYLPDGLYRIDKPLIIKGSNVVLRGAGSDQTRLWFRNGGGTDEAHKANLLITGRQPLHQQENSNWAITAEGEIFDTSVRLADTGGLHEGDDVSIAWDITEDFKAEHNSEAYWYHTELNSRKTFFRRTVSRVEGDRVHFKVPLRYPVKLRDNPVLLRASQYASENGVEALAFTNAVGVDEAWQGFNQSAAITLRSCKDCWVRDVKSFAHGDATHHVRSHGIYVERSFRTTVTDCHLEKAEHLGGGGNGYLFQLSRTNEVLVRDSIGREGRHNFSINWDFGASGNVFQRIESSGGLVCASLKDQKEGRCALGPTDFHHALAMANLFDNVLIDDSLDVGNRQDWSAGAGHTGILNVFWNVRGKGRVNAYNQGMGYVIGTGPDIDVATELGLDIWPNSHLSPGSEPEDYTELLGNAVRMWPQSLYDEQLARRLNE